MENKLILLLTYGKAAHANVTLWKKAYTTEIKLMLLLTYGKHINATVTLPSRGKCYH